MKEFESRTNFGFPDVTCIRGDHLVRGSRGIPGIHAARRRHAVHRLYARLRRVKSRPGSAQGWRISMSLLGVRCGQVHYRNNRVSRLVVRATAANSLLPQKRVRRLVSWVD